MKFENCPHCGGRIRSESNGWKCERCRGFIDMQGNFHEHVERPFMPPMTNADRIRAMSDEELAELISNRSVESLCDIVCGGECNAIATLEKSAHMRCVEIVLKHLQQSAEGE